MHFIDIAKSFEGETICANTPIMVGAGKHDSIGDEAGISVTLV